MVRKKIIFILIIIVLSLFFYLKTLLPGPDFSDVGELQAASCTLSIAHPPGYPTYIILGKLFSLIPINSPAWRINFMSAFFSILGLILFYKINQYIFKSSYVSFFATLILAFSQNFWQYSLVAEMYSLNVFFHLFFLYFILIVFSKKRRKNYKTYYLFFFLLGLAQGNHRGIIVAVPFFLLYLLSQNLKSFLNIKKLILMFISFILGLSIYLFIPLRSLQNPYLNYNKPNNWENFIYLITAKQFAFLMFAVPIKRILTEKIPWFCQYLNEQFFSFGIFLSLLGFIWFFSQRKLRLLFLFFLLFITTTFVWLAYDTTDVYRYLTPSFTVFSFFIAAGLSLIYSLISKIKLKILKSAITILTSFCLLYFVYFLLQTNYKKVDQSKNLGALNWGTKYLASLKPNAVVISYWPYSTVMWYLQGCEKIRPDIYIADDRVIIDKGWQTPLNTAKHFIPTRPVYIIPLADRVEVIKQAGFKVEEKNNTFEINL